MTAEVRRYLGDSTTVDIEQGCAVLTRELANGSERKLRLDPLVVGELLDWIEETGIVKGMGWRIVHPPNRISTKGDT